ncbi:MAG: hypothetical protein JNM32_01490 [Dechloromonas sp.]|nr:hypothetical protein [Dechloromonas sp.]
MQSPDTAKLNDALQAVLQQLDEATTAQAVRKADWTTAAAKGDDKIADKLEAEMEKAARVLQRLEVQRNALVSQINDAAEVERATHAARLKKNADALLAQSVEKFNALEPLAAALAAAVDALAVDHNNWRESQFLAKQAGATVEGFSSLDNTDQVHRVVESLGNSKARIAGLAREFSRISVFM